MTFYLTQLDRGVKHLAERLNVTNMADIVNVVILSDHGMTYASPPMKRHHPKGKEIPIQTIIIISAHRITYPSPCPWNSIILKVIELPTQAKVNVVIISYETPSPTKFCNGAKLRIILILA